ncbi:MAG: hypothetical protein U1E32_00805 [Rhodoglobus sp.]|nr:hypothetical protein [Rhodoglobus sp.]
MAKHTIEQYNSADVEVEATTYILSDGFFWFRNSLGTEVFTIKSSDVYSIKRDAGK